jgi:hypothetical protein
LISAIISGEVRHTIAWRHATYFIAARPGVAAFAYPRPLPLTAETEGETWVLGHEGPAVNALKVKAALVRT